jgi:hypothetical protein
MLLSIRQLRKIKMYEGDNPTLENFLTKNKRKSRILRKGKILGYGKKH